MKTALLAVMAGLCTLLAITGSASGEALAVISQGGIPNVGYGDGSDGDIHIPTGVWILPTGKNFRNFTVGPGAVVDLHGETLRVCGELVNLGRITDSASGGAGGTGGTAGNGSDPNQSGECPDQRTLCTSGGLGESGAAASSSNAGRGGSGGGGGGGGGSAVRAAVPIADANGGDGGAGGHGGNGGGYVCIYAYHLDNRGVIEADGGAGAPGESAPSFGPCAAEYYLYDGAFIQYDLAGGGGGGGGGGFGGDGGTVEVHCLYRVNLGEIHANGGAAGTGGSGGLGGTQRVGHALLLGTSGQEGYGCDGGSFAGQGGDGGSGEIHKDGRSNDGGGGASGQAGAAGHAGITYGIEVYPSADTYVDMRSPAANYGVSAEMIVENRFGDSVDPNNWEKDALVRFDLSALDNFPITEARLYVFYYAWHDNDPAGRPLRCRRITEEWLESSVTWNNRPTVSLQTTASAIVPAEFGWISWDVTNDVLAFQGHQKTNFGWQISDETTWGEFDIPWTRIYSKEHGTLIPFLELRVNAGPASDVSQSSLGTLDALSLTVSPNPSTGTVRIDYELGKAAQVSLTVVDVQGRQVAGLIEGTQEAGKRCLLWDGRDAAGRGVPTGVYFARMSIMGQAVMRKVVLMR